MNGYLLQAVSARSVHQEYSCAAFEVSAFIMNSAPKSEKLFNRFKGGKNIDHSKHLAFALRTSAVMKLSDEYNLTTYYHKSKMTVTIYGTLPFTIKKKSGIEYHLPYSSFPCVHLKPGVAARRKHVNDFLFDPEKGLYFLHCKPLPT